MEQGAGGDPARGAWRLLGRSVNQSCAQWLGQPPDTRGCRRSNLPLSLSVGNLQKVLAVRAEAVYKCFSLGNLPTQREYSEMNTTHYDPKAVGDAIDNITAGLERVMTGFANLKTLLAPVPDASDIPELDPRNPANKFESGKLTDRGIEVCYRLFDAGKSRYAVGAEMEISFGAATHRFEAWKKAGALDREKLPLN